MNIKKFIERTTSFVLSLAMLVTGFGGFQTARAADHRDSNAVDAAQEGDFSDVFAWVDPADNDKVILAFAVNVFLNPHLNPTYRFSEEYLYQMKIDNGGTPAEDLVMQVKFDSIARGGQGYTVTLGTPSVTGPRGNRELVGGTELCRGNPANASAGVPSGIFSGASALTGQEDNFILEGGVSNPRGTAASNIKCWAGVADDSFQTDVSQLIFRIGLNPNATQNVNNHTQDVERGFVSTGLGPLRGRPLRADLTSGSDGFGGYNASHVAVSIPRYMLTNGGQGIKEVRNDTGTPQRDPNRIGVWGTVSRPESENFDGFTTTHGDTFAQFERMGQQVAATVWVFNTPPLNETAITAGAVNACVGQTLIPGSATRVLSTPELKDLHNTTDASTDACIFRRLTPSSLLSGGILSSLQNTIEGRKTLLTAGGFISPGITGTPYMLDELPAAIRANTNRDYQKDITWPDYMRLNVTTPTDGIREGAATAGNSSTTFGLGGDGYQNGRRPADDVVDIYLRFAREMTDVQFGNNLAPTLLTGNPIPGYEPAGANPARRPLNCSNLVIDQATQAILVPCTDSRIFLVLQGSDFIERSVLDINNLANQVSDQRPLRSSFPYFGRANPVAGEPGTSEFPPQQ